MAFPQPGGARSDPLRKGQLEQGITNTSAGVNSVIGDQGEKGKPAFQRPRPVRDFPVSLQVGIVSDQLLFRILLEEHLATTFAAKVEISCGGGADLLQQISPRRRVDLLLVDGDGKDGVGEWLIDLRKRRVANKVVLFTDRPAGYIIHRVFQLGFNGLFHKHDSREVLHAALSTVLAGGFFVTPQVNVTDRSQFSQVLSEREVSVMEKLAVGLNPVQAARELSISVGTVLTHRRNFMRKLGLRSQLAVVLFAVRSGLVTLDQVKHAERKP